MLISGGDKKMKVIIPEEEKSRHIEVVFILDRSGSMSGLEEDTIGGFNATLKEQKKEEGTVTWSTVLFDHELEVIHDRVPIKKVKALTDREYYVRGTTALLDAIGQTITHIKAVQMETEEIPDKTLFVITTDGMENASSEYTYRSVKELIRKQTKKEGWEFLFLGANMDAVEVASQMGIAESHAARFHNDKKGIHTNYEVLDKVISGFRVGEEFDECALADIKEDYKKRKN